MGHIQTIGEEFLEKLHAGLGEDELVKWVKDRVLESYRNGLALRPARGEEKDKGGEWSGKKR